MLWHLAILSFGSASVLYRSNHGTQASSGSLLLTRQVDEPLPEDPPSCRPACTSLGCGAGDSCSIDDPQDETDELLKRSLGLNWAFSLNNATDADGTLTKRLFTYTAGETDPERYTGDRPPTNDEANSYLPVVIAGNEKLNFGNRLKLMTGKNEAACSKQREFKDKPFQIVTSDVFGCTVALLISNRAVWAAHFWEIYSNNVGEDGLGADIPEDPAFDDRVLKFIRGETVDVPAAGEGDYLPPSGPSPNAKFFNKLDTDETTLVIFTPLKDGAEYSLENIHFKNHYGPEGELVKAFKTLLGATPKIEVIPYRAVDLNTEGELLDTTARGHVVFQYDPNSDGNGKKAWRCFLESRFAYKDLSAIQSS
ncbi:hypothetical protein F5Y10DRAFT_289646 [Nemania abortiva]|nr:hypothetical protein F5Y10DRAFT_289646 [Nemania abortiva]